MRVEVVGTESAGEHSRAEWRSRALLLATGAIPLLGLLSTPREVTLIIYTLFVMVVVLRERFAHPPVGQAAAGPVRFWLLLLGTGVVTECLAWSNAYLKCDPQPALFHYQLGPDILLAAGFYSTWAVAWIVVQRFFAFSLKQAFITQGLYGVFVEQQGAIFRAGLASMPLGLVIWTFVFLVYGSTLGIPFALSRADIRLPGDRRSTRAWKYLAAGLLLALLLVPVSAGWGAALQTIGLIPPKAPVCAQPFW
jgi:hypothetical protein